jgi:CDP-2,3-bis-(O-geranylgeranyl)-sn-glycerol synthase
MSSELLFDLLVYPLAFILPAWVANGAPVLFGGGAPIDFGKKFMGKPLFGKHKTIKGTFSGLAAGILISLAESLLFNNLLATGIALSVGTMLGDLLGSFIKRRMELKEGHSVFLMDQYLFLAVALLLAYPFGAFPTLEGLIVVIILTGVLHRLTNILAHKAKIKSVPW